MMRALLVLAAIACAGALHAEDVNWDDLCSLAKARPLKLILEGDVTAKGVCSWQRGDVLTIAASGGAMSVQRDAIVSIRLDNLRPVCTPHDAGTVGEVIILSPTLALGGWAIPLLPVLLAGGGAVYAAMLPVCGVFDLIHLAVGSHAITIS